MDKKLFGAMLDVSRNLVMKPEEVVTFAKVLHSFGYNMLQLYTEDTFEVENEPYFGYRRGRYSIEELQYIVDECEKMGVEVIPCIQTLAHLNQMFVWKTYKEICDIDDVLLMGEERTYELIENMFKTLKKCFRSQYVHIGMDEAVHAGRGKYQDKHGDRPHLDLLLDHLHKVTDIAEKYGFRPMMWSDLFVSFVYNGAHYVEDCVLPETLKEKIPKNLILVHWDYSHDYQKIYDDMLVAHQRIHDKVWYAGGAFCWGGFSSGNKRSLVNMYHAMKSAKEHHVDNVIITLWHDNGGECPFYAMLPSLFAIRKFYDGETDMETIKKQFHCVTGEDFDALCALDLPNYVGGNQDAIGNVSKYMFYSDPFNGFYDAVCQKGVPQEFAVIAKRLKKYGKTSKYQYIFNSMSALCEVLARKYDLGARTRAAYQQKNKESLQELLADYRCVLRKIEKFYAAFRTMWYKENKPCGFDVQDIRIGGLKQRMHSCIDRLEEYLSGKIDAIPELEEKTLDISGVAGVYEHATLPYANRWRFIASANEL